MQAIDQKILSRIYGRGRGWAFTKIDFVAEFGEVNIHQALSSLARAGTIRRVCHGVYDYPRYSELLGQILSPDIDQLAQAQARKFNWRIQPAGDAALNLLGLSTQVPGRWVYLSDGPSRQYEIGTHTLALRKSALKDAGFKMPGKCPGGAGAQGAGQRTCRRGGHQDHPAKLGANALRTHSQGCPCGDWLDLPDHQASVRGV
jgi:hypothetical protein